MLFRMRTWMGNVPTKIFLVLRNYSIALLLSDRNFSQILDPLSDLYFRDGRHG